LYEYLVSFWEASMLGHGAGIGYAGPGPRMGPTDNFSLVTGSITARLNSLVDTVCLCIQQRRVDA